MKTRENTFKGLFIYLLSMSPHVSCISFTCLDTEPKCRPSNATARDATLSRAVKNLILEHVDQLPKLKT